jgi:predicted Fe-Mo cluster-binding NifX family protein
MKIAVATEDGKTISAHFGRSPFFAVYEIEEGRTTKKEMRPNTFTGHFRGGPYHENGGRGNGHGDQESHGTVAEALRDCKAVISQGMGRKAWEELRAQGIEMIVTDETEVEVALRMYLADELEDRTDKLH